MEPLTFESDEETLDFLEQYCEFGPNRAYILSAMARPKENEQINHGSIPMFREILTKEQDIRRKYTRLKTMAQNYEPEEGGNLDFRLYITANARDIQKSFHIFQKDLIDKAKKIANGHEQTRENIKRLDKEWESTLQTSGNKEDNYFIIDIDYDDFSIYEDILESLTERTDIKTAIRTPNGYHIITRPYNYTEHDIFDDEEIELQKDDMLFIRMMS